MQPLCSSFPILSQSSVPHLILTCFLTCIQVSQETDRVVWYPHLFKNFLQFVVIHTKYSIVSETEVDAFLEFPCFPCDPTKVDNLISDFSVFSKSSLYNWKFWVHVLLKPSLGDFEHYRTIIWNEPNDMVGWACFGIALVWDWNENWPFPVLWPLLRFPKLLTYWVQHFNSIIF